MNKIRIKGIIGKSELIKVLMFVLVLLSTLVILSNFLNRHNPKKVAEEIYTLCQDRNPRDACYAGNFYTLAKSERFDFTHKVLVELRGIDKTVSDCHFIAHQIALSEVGSNPAGWMSLFKEFSPEECAGGFLHGVIEGYGRTDSSFTITGDTLSEVCREVEKIHSEKGDFEIYRGCVHTMGHLLLVQEDGNVDKAVKICLSLPENSVLACSFGVFMENLQRQNLKAHGVRNSIVFDNKTKSEETDRCGQYSGIVSEACWQNISWFFNKINNYDQGALYEDCKKAPTGIAVSRCYTWGASVIGLYRLSEQIQAKDLTGLCDPLKNNQEFFNRCLKGVVSYLLLANSAFFDDVQNFCQGLEERDKNVCLSELKNASAKQ